MQLLQEIRECRLCQDELPLIPRPILQFSKSSRIIIIGQAPGLLAHNSGKPWNDKSGERLREWLGIGPEIFYDASLISIVPMGFCYPGRGKSGDLPPRKECRIRWLDSILCELPSLELFVLVGGYAAEYFLGKEGLESHIRSNDFQGKFLTLAHPSPRNNIWLAKNPWYAEKIIPLVKKRVHSVLMSKA
jgi:uracil-DNA glycosylase